MSTDQLAISVKNLTKRYRITRPEEAPRNQWERIRRVMLSPFEYLRYRLREPGEDEILWALRDVSFEVKRGQVLGLIGKNGAGKSTLLKILTRITEPTSGRAVIHGRVGSMLEVGTGFHPELTGRENVYLNGTILGMRRFEITAKFDQIVAFSGVGEFIDTPVKRYSSGMQVRLAFAVAAFLDPEVLLIDEVLAVGDAEFQKRSLGKMNSITQEGRTVVFVSHNMLAVQSLCDRVLLLENGRIVADGPPASIIPQYMAQHAREQREQIWETPDEAPGNDEARLHRVAVRPVGRDDEIIDMGSEFVIEIDFWKLTDEHRLDTTILLQTDNAIPVFTASSVLQPRQGQQPTGMYRMTCHVPGNLMNSGQFTVKVIVVRNEVEAVFSRDSVVSFEIQPVVRTAYYERSAGVIQPLLEWSVEQVERPIIALS